MKRVTYNQLGKALAILGFEKVEQDSFTAFKNGRHDAVIVLPKGIPSTTVGSAHLLTVEKTVTEKGIASPYTFARLLGGVRRLHKARILRVQSIEDIVVAQAATGAPSVPRRKRRLLSRKTS